MQLKLATLLVFSFALLAAIAANASAACCANPLTQEPVCIESPSITAETCCGDDVHFGKLAGAPKSYGDCISNFFSKESCKRFSDKCSHGCCMQDDFCQDNVPGVLCSSKFSMQFGGLCMKGKDYAISGCEKGCCCPGTQIMLKDNCKDTFYENMTEEADCRRICSKQIRETVKDMPTNTTISTPGPGAEPVNAKPVAKSKACTDMLDKKECVDANCYWCPEAGCGFDCTACQYKYDTFPDAPDRVCDDLCLGISCENGFYCSLGRCLQAKTPEISMKSFFFIFALILLIAVFIISSKTRSEK
jgi:hypothetical protein